MSVFSANIFEATPPEAYGSWVRRIVCLLVLALGATFCTLPPVLHNALPQSQDMVFHVFQAEQFIQNLNNGVLYPRWAAGAISGYGSPNFVYYSPFSYYLVAIIHLAVPSLVSSMVVATWLSFFLSGVMMLLLVTRVAKGYRALMPAILYQILPFHLYEVYVRGSFAALFAYIWFPLILLLLFKILDARRPALSMFCLGLAYSALIMTHLVSAYMFSLIIGVILFCFLLKGRFGSVSKAALACATGLGISSIYLIPVVLERKYVHLGYLINGPWGKYNDNYLFTTDKLRLDHTQFSQFYTLLHLGVIADLVLFGAILFTTIKKDNHTQKHLFATFTCLFLISFLLTVPVSKPLATMVPGLSTLQFPWRWMAIMEVTVAFLSAYLYRGASSDILRNSSFFLVFVVLSSAIVGRSSLFGSETLAMLEKPRQCGYKILLGVEYVPIWAHSWLNLCNAPSPEPLSFIAGKGACRIDKWAPQERIFKCVTDTSSRIRIATFYYPGWQADLDGKNVPAGVEKYSGAILLDVPKGEHDIRLRFLNTSLRKFAQWASGLSLCLAGVLVLTFRKKEF